MFIASPPRRSGLVSWHAQSNQKSAAPTKNRLLFYGLVGQTSNSQAPDRLTRSTHQPSTPVQSVFQSIRQQNHQQLKQHLAHQPELANALDPEDQTPILLEAVAHGDVEAANLLLESGADSLRPNAQGITPIVLATVNGNVPMVQLLLKKGVPLHSYYNNMPLMHVAAQAGQLAMLTALKEAGTDVNIRDAAKRTPLHIAAEQGNPEVVQWFLDNGAELEAKDSEGYTPFHNAVLNGQEAVFTVLQEAGADLNSHNDLGLTPYLTAAGAGKVRLMKALQAAGANTQALTRQGLTALHWAAGLNQAETLRHLLSPKHKPGEQLNPNLAAGRLGYTPLHLAVAFQSNEAIEELVKDRKKGTASANWHVQDGNGHAPWDYAKANGPEFLNRWRSLAAPDGYTAAPVAQAVESTPQPDTSRTPSWPAAGSEASKPDTPFVNLPPIATTSKIGPNATSASKAEIVSKLSPKTPFADSKSGSQSQPPQSKVQSESASSELTRGVTSKKSGKAQKKAKQAQQVLQPKMDEVDEALLAIYGVKPDEHYDTFLDLLNHHYETLKNMDEQGKQDFLSKHLNALNINKPYQVEITTQSLPSRRVPVQVTPLHVAILSAMPVAWLRLFMEKGADPTAKDSIGRTPFHLAALTGSVDFLNALSSKGKGVSQFRKPELWKNAIGNTPLHEAARSGHVDATQWFLNKKFPVNVKNENEETPLHLAANERHAAVVSHLLKHNANPEAQNIMGRTPLHLAALSGNMDVLNAFAEAPKKIDPIKNIKIWKNLQGNTPLHEAARAGHLEAVQWFIDHKFPINEPNNDCETALHLASAGGHTDVAKLLLASGANPEAKTNAGMTPLHSATHTLAAETLQALLRLKKFDPNATLANGSPALHLAVVNRDLTSVRLLLAHGANINQAEQGGRNALQLAVMLNDGAMVDELLKLGANPTQVDSEGENVLHHLLSTRKNSDPKVELTILKNLLRQLPAETVQKMVNTADNRFQNTPLHVAVAMGNLEAVKSLLANGADPTLINCAGKNSLMAAVDNNFRAVIDDIVKLLLNQPDEPVKRMLEGKTTEEGANVFHLAAALNLTDAMKAILEKQKILAGKGMTAQLDLNAQDDKGRTPLHYASMLGKLASVRFLLSENADPIKLDNDQQSPLMAAIEYTPQGNLRDPQEAIKTSNAMTDELLAAIRNQAIDAGKSPHKAVAEAVNQADTIGYRPLHMAATKGKVALLKKMLQQGADPTLVNRMGGSPLHIATDFENAEVSSQMVEALLEAYHRQGGTTLVSNMVQLKDNAGITPLYVAKVLKRPKLEHRMRHYGPDSDPAEAASIAFTSETPNVFAKRKVIKVPFYVC